MEAKWGELYVDTRSSRFASAYLAKFRSAWEAAKIDPGFPAYGMERGVVEAGCKGPEAPLCWTPGFSTVDTGLQSVSWQDDAPLDGRSRWVPRVAKRAAASPIVWCTLSAYSDGLSRPSLHNIAREHDLSGSSSSSELV